MIYKEKLIQILSTNEAIKKKAEEYNFIKINRLSIDGEELKNGMLEEIEKHKIGFEDLLYFIIRSKYLEFSIIANTFTIRNNETYYEFDIYFNFSKSLLQQDEEILRKLVEFLENNQ